MAHKIIFDTDNKDIEHNFQLEVFLRTEKTIRIFIDDVDSPYGTAWMDFNKESAMVLIKEIKNQLKKIKE